VHVEGVCALAMARPMTAQPDMPMVRPVSSINWDVAPPRPSDDSLCSTNSRKVAAERQIWRRVVARQAVVPLALGSSTSLSTGPDAVYMFTPELGDWIHLSFLAALKDCGDTQHKTRRRRFPRQALPSGQR
jgi:hypothetical protein